MQKTPGTYQTFLKKKTVTFSLPLETIKDINDMAKARNISKSDIVRKGIECLKEESLS